MEPAERGSVPGASTDRLQAGSIGRRLVSGGAWAFGGRVLTALLALVTNALLARLLSPAELGAYFLAFSVILFGMQLSSLGLNSAVVKFVAENIALGRPGHARRVATVCLVIGVAGAVLTGGVYALLGEVIGKGLFNAPAFAAVSGLVAGWMVVMTVQSLVSEVFRGFHDIRLATIFGGSVMGQGMVAGGMLCAGLLVLWFAGSVIHLSTVLLLALASGATSTLVSGWVLRRRLRSLPELPEATDGETPSAPRLLRTSSPMLATNLLSALSTQAPLWIVGAFLVQQQVALYGAAFKLVTMVALPLAVANAVVPPLIAELYSQGRTRELERALRGTAAITGIPAFAVLGAYIVFGSPILAIVYGSYYTAAFPILALLGFGSLANVWSGSCGLTLMMTGHQRLLMSIAGAGVAVVVGGAALAANYSGAAGVAVAVSVGISLQNLAMVLAARAVTGMWTQVGFGGIPSTLKRVRARLAR